FVVEAKDAYTGQHLERCRVYGMALMQARGIAGEHPDAEYGFLLHDAGKGGIPERILSKPGPLTAAEWRVMRTHPLIGYQMVSSIPFLKGAAEIVRYHHEMFDGSGYPEGLKAEEIPMPARVFSIVDAFDAMTTDRPYPAALPLSYAAEEGEREGDHGLGGEVVREATVTEAQREALIQLYSSFQQENEGLQSPELEAAADEPPGAAAAVEGEEPAATSS